MQRTFSALATALLLLGCATGPQLPEHRVAVGRVVSSQDVIVFIPGGIDVTAEEWGRIYTFAPLATPTEHITFVGRYDNCPSAEASEDVYLVLLDPQSEVTDEHGEYPLDVVGCTVVDEERSIGLR